MFLKEMGLYKEFESACQESERCMNSQQNDVGRKNCILECLAPTCYKILYEDNPVRISIYKSFFIPTDFFVARSRGN